MTHFLLALGIYLALFAVTEILRKRYRIGGEATRKVAHVFSGLIALALPFLLTLLQLTLLALGFLFGLAASKKLGFLQSIHHVPRKTVGAIVFPLAVLGTAALTWPDHMDAYVFGILTMALADTAAALFGRRKQAFRTRTTWVDWKGTSAFFLVTVCIIGGMLLFSAAHPPTVVLFAAPFILSLIERFSPLGFDNLTVPVAAAVLWMV